MPGTPLSYRLEVAVRALAAIGGAYGVTWLAVTALALSLPGRKVDVVIAATLLGLAIFPIASMWSFAARSAARAWGGLLLAALLCGAVIGLQRLFGGGA
jgi:hypothetical protein